MTAPTEKNSHCVLFLDFDGVTHPEPCFPENIFCRLPMIEAELRKFANLQIVVSSSWRDFYTLDRLRKNFSADLRPRVVGVTPSNKRPSASWLPGHVPRHEREWEIQTWMKENCSWDTPWLAIDDRAHWFSPDSPNLLLTQATTGFTQQNQIRLNQMLKERF